nr:RNA-directed DNA polymerase, eukaryota, reverse transcriptase zinc-binding domain protein [Tanacetum cinerariifolium]
NIRDGVEKSQLDDMLLLLRDFSLVDTRDSWQYNLDASNTFSVRSMTKCINLAILPFSSDKVSWNKTLPIKVNIHSWRLRMDRLPTRYNVDLRGIDLNSMRCPLCDGDVETSQHLFIDCPVACDMRKVISGLWGLMSYPNDLSSLLSWPDSVNFIKPIKLCFDIVIQTANWVLWRYRNHVCFDPPRKDAPGELYPTLGSQIEVGILIRIGLSGFSIQLQPFVILF